MGWSIKQAHVFVINYASKLSSKVGSKYGVAASSFLPAANYMPAERRIRRLQRKGQERTTHGRRTGKQAEERKGLSSVRPSVRPASLMAVSVTLTDWRALNCPFQSIQCHRVREREWRRPKCAWVCHPPTPPCVHSALKTCKSGRLSLLMSLVYTDTHVFVMTRTCIVR